LLTYEGFDYSPGLLLNGLNGGLGWSGGWDASLGIGTNVQSLTDPPVSLPPTGGSLIYFANIEGISTRNLAPNTANALVTNPGGVWMSIIFQSSQRNGLGAIIDIPVKLTLSVSNSGTITQDLIPPGLGAGQLHIGSASDLWLFHMTQTSPGVFSVNYYTPTVSGDPGPIVASNTMNFGSAINPATEIVALSLSNPSGNILRFDEIRFGTQLGDVMTPEPASLAAIGIGLVGLLRARRRRK
jgi:hypothetical protein